jgi:adenylate cyclase
MEEARQREAAAQERMRELLTRYLAPPVAEQLLYSPDAMQLGGARKDVTILFADVRGFTGFSEKREPEEVVAMLNRYLTLATSEIFAELGTLDKFLGDGVMAIFGAPLALPDHALAALRAAVAMRSRIDDLRRETGVRVGFGIGLNSGPAIVGNIGSERFMNYTVIGDVVNVSARLQAEARAGEILISDATLRLVADKVQIEELGSIYVKGRTDPVTTYKVLEVKD